MNLIHGTVPYTGMSREECGELKRDLVAGGVEVVRVEEGPPGAFRLYCHCPLPDHHYWITGATLFRAMVKAGLIEGIPPNTLP